MLDETAEACVTAGDAVTTEGSKIQTVIEKYIKLRDHIAEIKKGHKAELEPLNAVLEKIEGALLDQFNKLGVDSMKTAAGTAYKSIQTSATVADWDTTLRWIIENDMLPMLERRVNKTVVEAYREEHAALPPGINYSAVQTINIRRS